MDEVIIKGDQKIIFFVSHGIIQQEQIIPVEETPTIRELVQNVEHKCAIHANLKKFWCAQQKCYGILSYVRCIEKEEEEKMLMLDTLT